MKNFFKKLSFVMAAAMVVTSLHVPAEAKAASKDYVYVKGSKKAITSKSLFVGGQSVNFDYVVGSLKNKGANGKWSVEDTSIATVDKAGVVKAVGVGSTTLTFTAKKSKKVKKAVKKTVKLTTYARAEEVTVSPAAFNLKLNGTAEVEAELKVKEALLQAGVKSSYNVFVESANKEVVEATNDGAKIMLKGLKSTEGKPVVVTVYAAQKNTLEDAKKNAYVKKAELTVNVAGALEAMQVAGNKIKLTGTDLSSDKALYEIKNDKNFAVAVKAVEVNADKTEAVLEAEIKQIIPGTYNVTYNKKDTAMVMIAEAKVKSIEFLTEGKAVLSADNKEAYVYIKVLDTFGNDVTNTTLPNLTFNITAIVAGYDKETGKITFKKNDNKQFIMNLDKVTVTVVDKNTGVNKSETFALTEHVKLSNITYKGLFNNFKKSLVTSIKEDDEIKDFYLLVEVKDQFGKVVEDIDALKKSISITIPSITNVKIQNTQNPELIEHKDMKYIGYKLDKHSSLELKAGEAPVSMLSLSTGDKFDGMFTVTHKTKVDDFVFGEGTLAIYNKYENKLYYQAKDTDGKDVTDVDVLNKIKFTGVSASDSLKFVPNYTTGIPELIYKPVKADTTSSNGIPVMLTATTETRKFTTATLSVRNQKKPAQIHGFKKDTPFGVTKGNTLTIKYDQIRFLDEDNGDISLKEIIKDYGSDENYKIRLTLEGMGTDPSNVATGAFRLNETGHLASNIVNSAEAVLNEANKDGVLFKLVATGNTTQKADFKLELLKKSATGGEYDPISEKKFSLYSANLQELSNFTVADVMTLPAMDVYSTYTSAPDATKNQADPSVYVNQIKVFGEVDNTNVKVQLTNTDLKKEYSIFNGLNKSMSNFGDEAIRLPGKASIPAGQTTAKTSFKVKITTNPVTEIVKEYTFSNEAPKVAKVETVAGVDFNTAITLGTGKISWDDATNGLKAKFVVKDQYGQKIAVAPYVTFSVKKADAGKVPFKNNGALDAELTADITAASDIDVVVKLTFPGSNFVHTQAIKVKR